MSENEFENIKDYPVRGLRNELDEIYKGNLNNLIDNPSENLDEDIVVALTDELKEKLEVNEKIARKVIEKVNSYLLECQRLSKEISEKFDISGESAEVIVRKNAYNRPAQIIYDKPSNIQENLEKKIPSKDISQILDKRSKYVKEKNKMITDSLEELSTESIDELFGDYLEILDPIIYNDILSINPNTSEVIRHFTTMAKIGKLEKISPVEKDNDLIKKVDDLYLTLEKLNLSKEAEKYEESINISFASLDAYAHTIAHYLPNCYGIKTEFLKVVDGLKSKIETIYELNSQIAFFNGMDEYTTKS